MQHSFKSSSGNTLPNSWAGHEVQRPPYVNQIDNSVMQSLLQQSQQAETQDLSSDIPTTSISNQNQIETLCLSNSHQNDSTNAEKQWHITDLLHAWPNLPEKFILELDSRCPNRFVALFNSLLDQWFPVGHGYYAEGFLSADIEALYLGSNGILRAQRMDTNRFRVESRHSDSIGTVGRLGGKSNLFGKDWETEVEGQAAINGTMTEVFEFPIRNPMLLLPLMVAHGVFKTNLLAELLSPFAPSQYKSFRQSVTYGLGCRLNGMASYKSENPQTFDLAMAFGLNNSSMFEVTLHKPENNGTQAFELCLTHANGLSTELAFLIYNQLGIPKKIIDETVELGAKVTGTWVPKRGRDTISLTQFSILSSLNPEPDTVQTPEKSTQFELEYDRLPTDFTNTPCRWPERVRIGLIRTLSKGFGTDIMTSDIKNGLEKMGVNINSQIILMLDIVISQSTLKAIWKEVNHVFNHPEVFLNSLLKMLSSPDQDRQLSKLSTPSLMNGCKLKRATVRCSHQGTVNGALKVGMGPGVGLDASATMGTYYEQELLGTPLEEAIKALILRLGIGLN
ncbi:MAG: hypothetical protein VXZ96_16220 [Myxococcota bacterium]|nr:hypothetical protein [Myxococcota bacterium]